MLFRLSIPIDIQALLSGNPERSATEAEFLPIQNRRASPFTRSQVCLGV
mgnify:CR=1 FL=1